MGCRWSSGLNFLLSELAHFLQCIALSFATAPFFIADFAVWLYLCSELLSHSGVFSMHAVALLLQNQPDPEMIRHIALVMLAIIPIIMAVVIAIVMVPCWFILKKAGFTPWLSLLCIVPSLGTLVLLYLLAFGEWKVVPVAQAGWGPPPPYPPPPPYTPPPTVPPQA
jgi:hypothetical protein